MTRIHVSPLDWEGFGSPSVGASCPAVTRRTLRLGHGRLQFQLLPRRQLLLDGQKGPLGECSRLAGTRLGDPHSGAIGKRLGLSTQVDQKGRQGLVPVHLLVMPMGEVQPVLGRELRPDLDETSARRPGHQLDLGLGARGKDRCASQRLLARANPGIGLCPVLSPPGTKMVAPIVRDSARRPLDLSVLGNDGLGVLALKVTPDDERDLEAFHNNKREMHRFFMYMEDEGESSESLECLPRGIHDPGAGRRTPRMRAPTLREQVLSEDAWSGPCVHHRGHSNRVLIPETQGGLDLEIILTQDEQSTPTCTRCSCGYLGA